MPKNTPNYLVVVRSLINNEKGEVLIVKRQRTETYNPGMWELPGGKLMQGESLEDAAERLVNKEVNIVVDLLPGNYYCKSQGVVNHGKYKGYTYLEITLVSKYVAGEVQIEERTHSDSKWIPLEKAFEYDLSVESKKAITLYIRDIKYPRQLEGTHRVPVLLVARALIQNNRGKYLLLKRAEKDFDGNTWEIPGGKIDKLENLPDSLKREVLEETGLLIDVIEEGAYTQSRVMNEGRYNGFTVVTMVSTAKVRGGKVKLSEEHEDAGWFTEREILNLNLSENIKYPLLELLYTK